MSDALSQFDVGADGRWKHFARDGAPIGTLDWARAKSDAACCRVALDKTADAEVSTVWLGIDHRYRSAQPPLPPLIFETKVFGGPADDQDWRWSTEAKALAGHAAIVAWVKAGAPEHDAPEREP